MEIATKSKLAIAPMMKYTDAHFRFLARIISKNVTLYTEMLNENAACRMDDAGLVSFLGRHVIENTDDTSNKEDKTVIQLGGSCPMKMAQAAKRINQLASNCKVFNINSGCPSDRVQFGNFGAVLMKNPTLVANIAKEMKSQLPDDAIVTVKCRIGIDNLDSFEFFKSFVETVHKEGNVNQFIIHARKAWLKGLSPKHNRKVPPINYEYVYRIAKEMPNLDLCINGEITAITEIKKHLDTVDSVMIGRLAYNNPMLIQEIEREISSISEQKQLSTTEVLQKYSEYLETLEQNEKETASRNNLLRPIMNIFHGKPLCATFKKKLSGKIVSKQGKASEILRSSIEEIDKVMIRLQRAIR